MGDSNDEYKPTKESWIGRVAADKEANSVEIKVIVPELTPTMTGNVGAVTATNIITNNSLNGKVLSNTATTANAIKAVYWGVTNRDYPPDVVQGEQVVVTKWFDSDIYYWDCIGRNDNLRKQETLRISISDCGQQVSVRDDTNSYFFEMDTKRGKHIRMRTCTKDGEKFQYQLDIDALASTIRLGDFSSNELYIDSVKKQITVHNNSGSFVTLLDKNILINAEQDIIYNAKRQMIFQAPYATFNINNVTLFNTNAFGISGNLNVNGSIGSNGTIVGNAVYGMSLQATSISYGGNGSVQMPSTSTGSGTGVGGKVSPGSGGTELHSVYMLG